MRRGLTRTNSVFGCFTAAVAVFFCVNVYADSNWQWSGFVSQAGVYTSDNSFFSANSDDHLSGEFSEVGVIGTGSVLPGLDFASQIISRRAGVISDGNPRFDYIQLTYRFFETMNSDHAFKVGRFKTPLGFYNDTREVPFTRPGIFLPQGIYWEKVRNTRSFINGGQYLYDYRRGLHEINFSASAGSLQVDQAEFDAQTGAKGNGTLDPGRLKHLSLMHDYDGGRVRLGFSAINLKTEFKARSSAFVNSDGTLNAFNENALVEYSLNVFSFEYNAQRWSFTAEYMLGETKHGQTGLTSAIERPESSYFQITHRLKDNIDVFFRYDSTETDKNDPRGIHFIGTNQALLDTNKPLLQGLGIDPGLLSLGPTHSRYAFDKTLGMGWWPTNELLFRAEWHRVIGTSWIANYGLNNERLVKEWDLFALQLSYKFK